MTDEEGILIGYSLSIEAGVANNEESIEHLIFLDPFTILPFIGDEWFMVSTQNCKNEYYSLTGLDLVDDVVHGGKKYQVTLSPADKEAFQYKFG